MNPLTRFLVVASDGIWEFLSNKQVLDIVERYYDLNDAQTAAAKVVEAARKFWRKVNLNPLNLFNFIQIGG